MGEGRRAWWENRGPLGCSRKLSRAREHLSPEAGLLQWPWSLPAETGEFICSADPGTLHSVLRGTAAWIPLLFFILLLIYPAGLY